LAQQGVSPETVDGIVAAGNVNQFPTFSNRPKVFKNRSRLKSPGFIEHMLPINHCLKNIK